MKLLLLHPISPLEAFGNPTSGICIHSGHKSIRWGWALMSGAKLGLSFIPEGLAGLRRTIPLFPWTKKSESTPNQPNMSTNILKPLYLIQANLTYLVLLHLLVTLSLHDNAADTFQIVSEMLTILHRFKRHVLPASRRCL